MKTHGLETTEAKRCRSERHFDFLGEMNMANTKGQEEIRVGKGKCVISWSKMGKEELICALGTLMDLIEYGDKYRAMPEFFDPAFKREFETIMKTLKAPSKKGTRLQKERHAK